MRLTTVILILSLMQVKSATFGQRITIDQSRITLKSVFKEIRKQSGYDFYAEGGLISNTLRVDVKLSNATIDEALKAVLQGLPLTYLVGDKVVTIRKKDISSLEKKAGPVGLITVSGTVTDEHGEPVPGISITIKGSSKGTSTDSKGNFMISVPDKDAVLVFSSIGFKKYEVLVGDQTVLKVRLLPAENSLNDVVVIGYGETTRKDLVGSVAKVNISDFGKAPVASLDQALAGRVAGVQVSSTDGQPGAAINITIRGANSLTQDNSPLYVVDGFPIEANDNGSINPADIESLDILKDAAATAIYGARGANGVIIITTKRGKVGAPVVSYNAYYGLNNSVKKIPLMNPYEFVKLQLEINNDIGTAAYLTSQSKTLEDYRNVQGLDWYDKVLQTARMQSHTLAVRGGTAQTKYVLTGSSLGQDGLFVNTGFKRYQVRLVLDQTINDKLKIGINTNYGDTREYGTIASANEGIATASLMYSIWGFRPIMTSSTINDPNNNLEDELFDPEINKLADYRTNPLIQLKNELREKLSSNLLSNAYGEYTFVKGLKLRVTGGVSKSVIQANAFNNTNTRTGSPDYPLSLGVNGSEFFARSTSFTNENTLTYSRIIHKDHNINIVGGYSQQTGKVSNFGSFSTHLSNESLGLSGLDEGTPNTTTSTSSNWALQSFFGRLNYSYQSKYSLNAVLRADGSSKFAKGNRWGYFPSAGLSYRISAEQFMKPIKFISDAKIRVTYGATGNNRVSDFAYLSAIQTTNSTGYSFGGLATPIRGTYSGTLGNPLLKWETTYQFDAGLDLSLWKDRVSFTGDYYHKRTHDLLLSAQLPNASGYSSAFKNIGEVSNSGVELALNTINVSNKSFNWASGFNISFNRNKVLALTQNQESIVTTVSGVFNNVPVYIAKIGQPIGQIYGVMADGLYQYSDFDQLSNGSYVLKNDVPANGAARANIRPGDAKYVDLNHDGVININDYTVIGNPNPDFVGGFSNNFEYKGFDLNVFFQFSYGNDVINANRAVFENSTPRLASNINKYASYSDRWSPENPNSSIPRVNSVEVLDLYSSRIVEDASYLRLKTISLGYNLPAKLLNALKIKSLRVYASAQNLFTWTNYSGVDPDVSTRNSTLTPGFDYSPYPQNRTFVFGLNTSF